MLLSAEAQAATTVANPYEAKGTHLWSCPYSYEKTVANAKEARSAGRKRIPSSKECCASVIWLLPLIERPLTLRRVFQPRV